MIIRKLTIGPDYLNAMHYQVGNKVFNHHIISNIYSNSIGYEIYIKDVESNEIKIWKHINKSVPVTVEYDLHGYS
jgi:hypothetical protein